MKTDFSVKTKLGLDLDGIAKRLFVLFVLLVLTAAVSYAADDQNANEQSVPQRITTENPLGIL